ncbi:PREDICTED: RRP12-like protein [Nicrophorus vespilloides]|uniref:RRP12-like protein n=1 Tax=Nicrophorus vespilloides TaxID=110193 RepID=A0ABM1MVX8_NICVS|nr:PREDICTED: RRP12-like protein [Nicrophorus vespilloides]
MGKFRSKLKGQTKGKRWPKGQSSNSNPETKKYRDLAKSRFFQENLGASSLTTDALKKHDAVQYSMPKKQEIADQEMDADDSGTEYSVQSSCKSFASEWSDCTNVSYNRFLTVFRSDSALHKEMLAILAAVTEVIKQNGGTETPTEYYCTLLTTLEQLSTSEEATEDQMTAVLSLLNMGIKKVPTAVLRTSFGDVTSKLLKLMNQYCTSDNNVIIKSIFGVLGVCLREQELAIWTHSQTLQIFASIVNPFCVHSKPKWRKAAQQAVFAVIGADIFKNENNYNPAADKVAEFSLQALEACLGTNSNGTVLVSSIQAGQTTMLHTLNFLKDTICYFNKGHLKACGEMILKLMSLNYPLVTSGGLQVLHALFSSAKAVASAKFNGQMITALYDYQPSSMDAQPTLAWLTVMQQAHVHLADIDIAMCAASLPKVFTSITQLWLSQKSEIVMAATRAVEMLLKDAAGPICADPDMARKYEHLMSKCFQTVELGLGYQYNHAWPQVLHCMSVMFEIGGANCSSLLLGCLKTLSELRDSYKFSYNNELEHAVGAAIRFVGPETVLSVISLKKDNGELILDRSWLIPVLKENVRSSKLDFWIKGILPLATACQNKSAELTNRNDAIGAHSAELLYLQLWNLLPSFCNSPIDISASFKGVARILGVAISEHKELRLAVMASLRKLITSAKETENEADIAELARFDKNYLPILFNVYTTKPFGTDEEGQRLAALDTIAVYLTIARAELTKQLFDNALSRLENLTGTEEMIVKESILDLIRILVRYQDAESVEKMFMQCVKHLPDIKDNKEQKKAYRLMEEICGSEAEGVKEFLRKHRKLVQKLLMKTLQTAAVQSKVARLRCLNFLLKAQPALDHDSNLIKSTIPEAVLCCKDIKEKTRLVAFDLLNTIGGILETHDRMQEFVTMVIAGLAGDVHLMASTILALASILHNFTGTLGQNNISLILDNILMLLTTPTREIVDTCLSFMKIYISSLPSPIIATSLQKIVSTMCDMNKDCATHFRMKTKRLLEKLIRKFGCDAIMPYVPTTDTVMYKRLRNMRKMQNRMKRLRKSAEEQQQNGDVDMEEDFLVKSRPKSVEEILADSDSDFDDDEVETNDQRSRQKKYKAYIQEDEDDIIDFKDPTVINRIVANKPTKQTEPLDAEAKKKAKDRGFKTTTDGRLIINELDSDDSDGGGGAKRVPKASKINFGESDSDTDCDDDAATEILRDSKRKRSDASSVASSMVSKYKPGGSGIHRNVGASTSSVYSGTGSEYKSKKASGDVKKKNKVDPYAYVPLERSTLNKRKKTKRLGQFKNIIGAARLGAKKGLKAKRAKK